MSIDWFTVAAQAMNFLILVWLLHKFLYTPITQAVRSREAEIQSRLEEAAEMKRAAEAEAERLNTEQQRLSTHRAAMLSAVEDEVAQVRRALETQARADVSALRETWRRDTETERDVFMKNLRLSAVRQFFAMARGALGDLAGRSLNDAISEKFAEQLERLDPLLKEKLAREAEQEAFAASVVSSFEMSAPARARLLTVLREVVSPRVQISHLVDERLVFGIELIIGGQTVAWGLESYLARLEERMETELAEVSPGAIREPSA